MKKLYRNKDDSTFLGFFSGLGDYFKIDPVILRILFIFILLITGLIPGIIAYLLSVLIVPKK